MFQELLTLKRLTYPNGFLTFNLYGKATKCQFVWNQTIELNDFRISRGLKKKIPEDLMLFYLHVANGAKLFYEPEFGQWGYEIYSLDNLQSQQNSWKESFGLPNNSEYLFFCELYGEASALAYDLTLKMPNLIDAHECNNADECLHVADSLDQWLIKLILNNGEKYWEDECFSR